MQTQTGASVGNQFVVGVALVFCKTVIAALCAFRMASVQLTFDALAGAAFGADKRPTLLRQRRKAILQNRGFQSVAVLLALKIPFRFRYVGHGVHQGLFDRSGTLW